MRESAIEACLVKRVKHLGGEIRKVQWIGRKNAPDRLVCLPSRIHEWDGRLVAGAICHAGAYTDAARSFFIELKRDDLPSQFPRDAHERAQHREHERMRKFGMVVHVVQSLADLDEVLR
jgi:hypothetical protein